MLNNFFGQISIFWGNCKKLVWGSIWPFFRKTGLLRQKINVTRFIMYYVTNVLLLNKFFEKSNIFGKKCENPFVGGYTILRGGASGDKNQYNIFCMQWGFKYFWFNNFFSKEKPIFSIIRTKNYFWWANHFWENRVSDEKN